MTTLRLMDRVFDESGFISKIKFELLICFVDIRRVGV
jgi:hypothetical protein